jgi:hypothetical protein
MAHVILKTNYENAEYDIRIVYDRPELYRVLKEELKLYEQYFGPINTDNMAPVTLISKTLELGNKIVEQKMGWGVRAIRSV